MPGGGVLAPLRYLPVSWARFWRPQTVALDLGTDAFRLAYVGNRSLVEVPARGVLDPRGRIVAIGKRAQHMEERLPDNWRLAHPVEVGHLSHPAVARQLVRLLLSQVQRRRLWKPRAHLAEPSGMTPMERTVFAGFLRDLPLRECFYVEPAFAQAVGAGIQPRTLAGLMVIDVGAQRTAGTVLSYGRPVLVQQWGVGGHHFTLALRGAVEDAHRLRVPLSEIERWKRAAGDARIAGQDRLTGRLVTLELPEAFALKAMEGPMSMLLEYLGELFRRCSAALRIDVQQQGVLLVGGGASLPSLRHRLCAELGLDVRLPEQPARCLVRGLARLAQHDSAAAVAAAEEPLADLFPLEA